MLDGFVLEMFMPLKDAFIFIEELFEVGSLGSCTLCSPIKRTECGSFSWSSFSRLSIFCKDFGSVGVNVKARFDFSCNCFISCEYSCNPKFKLRVIDFDKFSSLKSTNECFTYMEESAFRHIL